MKTELALTIVMSFFLSTVSYSQVSKVRCGSSSNIYTGLRYFNQNFLHVDDVTKTILFTHRGETGIDGALANGDIIGSWSSDTGITWTHMTIATEDPSHRHRYPSGVLYNPLGNTSPLNLFAVSIGPSVGSSAWSDVFLTSKRLDNTNSSVNYIPISYGNQLPGDLAINNDGKFHYIELAADNGTINIRNGTFNSVNNSIDWETVQINHRAIQFNPSWSTRFKLNSAWSLDGNVGYVYFIGIDSAYYTDGLMPKSYQPTFYKTTDGGLTWSKMPAFDFNSFPIVSDSIISIGGQTYPYFKESDMAIDNSDCLHLFAIVKGQVSLHNDSLEVTSLSEKDRIYHFWYTQATGWEASFITKCMTREVLPAESGYGVNYEAIGWGHNLQVTDGSNGVILTWTDTDTTEHPGVINNLYPDLFVWNGTNITNTTQNTIADDSCFFHTIGNTIINGEIPVVYAKKGTNPNDPVTWYYIKGINAVAQSSYINCGNSTQLDASALLGPTATYSWSPVNGLNNPNIPNPIANPTVTTTYTVTASEGASNTSMDITVTVLPMFVDCGADKNIVCSESVQLSCNSSYNGPGALTYSWDNASSLSNASISDPIANPTTSTTYTLTVTTPGATCQSTDQVYVNVEPITVNCGPDHSIICGSSAQLICNTNYSGTGTLTYLWDNASSLNDASISNPVADPIIPTTYTVNITAPGGICQNTNHVFVDVEPLTISTSNYSSQCGSPLYINTSTNYTGSGTLSYNWTPSIWLDGNTSSPLAFPDATTIFYVTVTTPNGCTATNSSTITITPLQYDEICIVTVDTLTGMNKIIWQKTPTDLIDQYYIFRQATGTNYNYIDMVPYANTPEFIDVGYNSSTTYNRYRISVVDTCGNESVKSPYHQTIHLAVSQGVPASNFELNWDPYIDEADPLFPDDYYIFRGTTPANMTILDTVPGTVTSYTDQNVFSPYYYSVRVQKTCSVNMMAGSNVVFNDVVGNNILVTSGIINISPNPMNSLATLNIPNLNLSSGYLTIFDLTGKLIRTEPLSPSRHPELVSGFTHAQFTIERGDLKPGIYFVELKADRVYRGKLVVE